MLSSKEMSSFTKYIYLHFTYAEIAMCLFHGFTCYFLDHIRGSHEHSDRFRKPRFFNFYFYVFVFTYSIIFLTDIISSVGPELSIEGIFFIVA